nr:immunoglobulin light chain junction region [Macaca mulatta]
DYYCSSWDYNLSAGLF